MDLIKYMDTIIVDSKDLFTSFGGIKSLGSLIHIEYEDFRFAFSGFQKLGGKLGGIPILISMDRKKGVVYIFKYIENNRNQRRLWSFIYDYLKKEKYSIIELRLLLEEKQC